MPSASFHILEGEDLLKHFEWSPGEQRVFCGNCGSPLFKRNQNLPGEVRLRLGCLDVEIQERPALHVFVEEKPAWSEITDSLPQFARAPERRKPQGE